MPRRIAVHAQGLPNDRVRRLIRGEVAAATVLGAQYHVVLPGAGMGAARHRLRRDQFLHYWTRELPEDITALVDVRRFGPGWPRTAC